MSSYFELILQATVVLGLALGASIVLRRRSASAHIVWSAAFVGLILLPILSGIVGPRLFLGIGAGSETVASSGSQAERTTLGYADAVPTASMANVSSYSPNEAAISLEVALLTVWAVGFLLALSRTLFCLWRLRVLRRKASLPVGDDDLSVDVRALARRVGLRKNWEVRVCVSPKSGAAMTWGILPPVVLLPKGVEAWSQERLEAVLLHEFAHVRRNDFASQLLAEFACALYWFHPLAWIGARSMRENAELATDDAVLRLGVKATSYAAELLHLAVELGKRSPHFQSGVHFMYKSKFESRIRSILSPSARRRGLSSVQLLAMVAIVGISVTAVASVRLGSQPASDSGQTMNQVEREEQVAMRRARDLAMATQIFANDYDDRLPSVANTQQAREAISPYVLIAETLSSPAKGGSFEFNLNLSGVLLSQIPNPSEVPLWIERVPNGRRIAVSFLDGHAELISPANRSELEEAAAKVYARSTQEELHLKHGN
ncbi:MAG: M56 family metallopeptidase [Fimbriimonadaceae bacterium]|nr:M56 family metallopeptidase [Fimbriimonadaceae bacterium]